MTWAMDFGTRTNNMPLHVVIKSLFSKMSDTKDFEPEEEVKVIMRIKIIFHITRMDDVSDVLKKAEELKKEHPHTEISIEVLV